MSVTTDEDRQRLRDGLRTLNDVVADLMEATAELAAAVEAHCRRHAPAG